MKTKEKWIPKKELSEEQKERKVELFTVYKDVGKLFIRVKYSDRPVITTYEFFPDFWRPIVEIIDNHLWASEKKLCKLLKETVQFQDSVEKAISHLSLEEKSIMWGYFGWEIFEFAEMDKDKQKKYIDKVLEN